MKTFIYLFTLIIFAQIYDNTRINNRVKSNPSLVQQSVKMQIKEKVDEELTQASVDSKVEQEEGSTIKIEVLNGLNHNSLLEKRENINNQNLLRGLQNIIR